MAAVLAPPISDPPKSEGSRPAILIVEDEAVIADNLQQTLTELGYDAYAVAASSEEAFAQAGLRCPDLVLMDVRIQGERDGIETAAMLRERFDVPILYLTAHADLATIERAKTTDPLGYLVKPVKKAELRSALEIALYRSGMERRLRARERWFSTTLESIADAVIAVDLSGAVTFMNPMAEQLVGMKRAEAIGKPAREVLQLDPNLERNPLEIVLREKRAVQLTQARLTRSDGGSSLIGDSASPVIEDGKLLGAVMVFRDITEQRRLEQQLELADRLASLGTMAAGVAHEINNPLAVVAAGGDILSELVANLHEVLETSEAPTQALAMLEEAAECQVDVLAATSRISAIVKDLLAFSKGHRKSGESADVKRAIEWAMRFTSHEFRLRARVVMSVESPLRVKLDELRLGQILINLLVNAAHSIEPGSAAKNQVSIGARLDDAGQVVLEVRDTGSGIPEEVRQRIFEPFFTTKAPGVGTGLGLSICHGIVVACGGKIEVESALGHGTLFRVALPQAQSSEPAPSSPTHEASGASGRLLVVDDDELVLRTVSRILSEHCVTRVTSAHEALTLLEQGEDFDVILADLMMPDMSGMALFEELLRSHPAAAKRVVFITGGATTTKVSDFLDTVPNLRLMKPFSVASLRAVVQRVLREAEQPSLPDS